MSPQSQQCITCKHFRFAWTCDAFPDGIPTGIATGQHDHTEPFPGDNGIRFEPIDTDDG